MTAEILSIGDELLIGQVVNTNASWLGERLTEIGIEVRRVVALGDDLAAIRDEVDRARKAQDLVIVTGGLGPTHDDVTKTAIADLFDAPLEFQQDLFDALSARFERARIPLSSSHRTQAEVPRGFEALTNQLGSAPGLLRDTDGCLVVVLPGVPREMKGLFNDHIAPRLEASDGLQQSARVTLLTSGIGESSLHDRLGDLGDWAALGCRLAFLPSIHGVRMRLTATGINAKTAKAMLAPFESHVREHAGHYLFGVESETLEEVVGRLLTARGWTIGTAESCTGGLVSSRLTDVPGSSSYVMGGVVAYDNAVKHEVLGVSAEDLEHHGAVSREVVAQMAEGVRRVLGVDVGLATSGVMGPGGGSEDKPVGTLWMAVSTPDRTKTHEVWLRHGRLDNKARAATAVLNLLRLVLKADVGEG